jgi:hypothetical protein
MGHIGLPILRLTPFHLWLLDNKKIKKTVDAIKKCGWRTTNEFVEGFYGSSEAVQSLRYQPGSSTEY